MGFESNLLARALINLNLEGKIRIQHNPPPPPPLLPISLHAGSIHSLPKELDDEFVNEPMVPSHAVAYD